MASGVSRREVLRLVVLGGSGAVLAGLTACTSAGPAAPAATSAPPAPANPTVAPAAKPAPTSAPAGGGQTAPAAAKKASFTLGMPEMEVAFVGPILTVDALSQKGYEAKYRNFGSASVVLQGTVSGEVQLVHSALAAALNAITAGSQLTALNTDQRMNWVLGGRADISSPSDLNGKVMAIGASGTTTSALGEYIAKKAGITPQFVRNNASEQSMQALVLGQVDAAVYSVQDQITADQKAPGKTKVLVDYSKDLGPDFVGYAIWSRNDFLQANPGLQQDLITTMEEVYQKLYGDKEYALSQIKRLMPDLDSGVSSSTYDFMIKSEIWPKSTKLTTQGLEYTQNWLSDNGLIKQKIPVEQWAKAAA